MRDKKCYHKLTIKCHVNKSSNSNTAIIQEHGGCPLPASTTTTTKSAKTELTQSAAREKLRKLYLVQIIPAAYANSMNGCNCVCVCVIMWTTTAALGRCLCSTGLSCQSTALHSHYFGRYVCVFVYMRVNHNEMITNRGAVVLLTMNDSKKHP